MNLNTVNIIIVICSMMIEMTLIRYYTKKKALPVKNNILFLNLIKAGFAATAVNFLTLLTSYMYPAKTVLQVHYAGNIVYFVLYEVTFVYVAKYLLWNATGSRSPINRALIRWSPVIVTVMTLAVLFLYKDLFYIDQENTFHYGTRQYAYAILPFILITLSFAVFLKKQLKVFNERTKGIISGTLILLIGILVDGMARDIVLIDFFFCFSIMIYYISAENPSLSLSERNSCYNTSAFELLVNELIEDKTPFYIYGFELRNINTIRSCRGTETLFTAISNCGQWLESVFPDAYIFYMGYRYFNILSFEEIDEITYSSFMEESRNRPFDGGEGCVYFWTRHINVDTQTPMCKNATYIINGELYAIENASCNNNRILVDARIYARIANEIHMHGLIEQSLTNDLLQIYIQPICSAETGIIEGGEILTRILDASGRIIMPGDFIPLAEKSGMITPLSYNAFEKTCQYISESHILESGIKFININCSPVQFEDLEFVTKLKTIAERYSVDFSVFKFEITESRINNNELMKIHISKFKKYGASIAIDDFGKGNSTLSRLIDFEFDIAKIDMNIVWTYFKNNDMMLEDIIHLLEKRDLTIIAEGVESEEMASQLKKMGCDYLQGYYYARPLTTKEFLAYIQ